MEDHNKTHQDGRALILTPAAVCLETLFGAFLLLRIPADTKNAFFLGLSKERLLMLCVFGLLFLLNIILIFCRKSLYAKVLSKKGFYSFLCCAVPITLFFVLLPAYRFDRAAAYYTRLKPFLIWIFLASLTFYLFCRFDRDRFADVRTALRNLRGGKAFIFGVLIVLICGIAFTEITGLGKTEETALWNKNGIPLQSIQLYSAFIIFLLLNKLGVIGFFAKRSRLTNFLLIWAVSALVWSLAPFSDHFFAPGPYDPELQYYPYSDAVTYDISAQTALNGWGFNLGRTVLKPAVAYISFLTHLVTGNDFNRSMLLQSALYAVLPAVIYLFGSAIGGSGCGYLAAAFSLLKEWNALNSHSVLTIHSRLVMSEFLMQILLAVLCYAVFRWMKKNGRESLYAAAAGGALALGIYTRYNFLAFLPASLLILGISYRKELRKLLKPLAVFFLTVFLSVSPILIRDSFRSGGTVSELVYTIKNILIAQRFTNVEISTVENKETEIPLSETATPEVPTTETAEASAEPVSLTETAEAEKPGPTPVSGEKTQIAPVSVKDTEVPPTPTEEINTGEITQEFSDISSINFKAVFLSMINHGMHNFISSALTVPMELSFQDLEHLYETDGDGLWIDHWDGNFTVSQWAHIAVWVLLFSAAGGMLLKTQGLAGFSIVYFWLVYSFSIGFSRSSGGRYVVPCNWIPMLLLSFLCVLIIRKGEISQAEEEVRSASFIKTAAVVCLFAAFFTSMTVFELLMPSRITASEGGDLKVLKERFADREIDWKLVRQQQKDKVLHVTHGVVLYPRFYYYQKGEHAQSGALMAKDFSRMTFTGINLENKKRVMQDYVLPYQELISEFPQDSVFRVISCPSEFGYEDVLAVTIETPDGQIFNYLRDPLPEFSCPVPEPVCKEIGKCY